MSSDNRVQQHRPGRHVVAIHVERLRGGAGKTDHRRQNPHRFFDDHIQRHQLVELRLQLKLAQYHLNMARHDLSVIYTSNYWRWLDGYWEVQRAWKRLWQRTFQKAKEFAKTVLPLAAQQWLVRTKRRYAPLPDETPVALSLIEPPLLELWEEETLPGGVFDVICFSVIEWDFRFQRPQQLMTQMARAGHRVFYISQHFRSYCRQR